MASFQYVTNNVPYRLKLIRTVQNPDEVKIRIGNLTREFCNLTDDHRATALRKFVQIETNGAQLQSNELQLLRRLVGIPICKLIFN